MKTLPQITELVGGPQDGCMWSSDWTPHLCPTISWGTREPNGRQLWAEYELGQTSLMWHDGPPWFHLRYYFVGFREWFPNRISWLTTMHSRWVKRMGRSAQR